MGEENRPRPLILVVDDDDDVREIVSLLLTEEGYDVVTAPNGAIALEHLDRQKPSAIILDLMMPVMSGWDFWDAHQQSQFRAIPVVVLTATGLGPGCLGKAPVLKKPVGRDQLLETVGSLCA